MLTTSWLRGLSGDGGASWPGPRSGWRSQWAPLATLGSFLTASKATMAARSVQQVAVAWQVQARPGAGPTAVLNRVRADPVVAQVLSVRYATTTALTADIADIALSTGAGQVLEIPPTHPAVFGGVASVGLAATGLAAAHTIRVARRPTLAELRDL